MNSSRVESECKCQLILPQGDCPSPELSIVIPALNEEITISEFVEWCKIGIENAKVSAEILIIDSSSDRTAELAVAAGARVLKTPKRGLGRAYIDSIPYIRGRYIIMGDCDCTYDFRNITPFVKAFTEGYQYIMGSRFKGYIEKNSMPKLHQYFGTPITTWFLNFIYRSDFSDIHCGMRGITKEALLKINLRSQSWEYASEMVIKAIHWKLKRTEVPVRFLKDKDGRISHHLRIGWMEPWRAGWLTVRTILTYKADLFFFYPGIFMSLLGMIFIAALSNGPIHLAGITLSIYWMIFWIFFAVIGINFFLIGSILKSLLDPQKRQLLRLERIFSFNRSTILAKIFFLLGLAMQFFLVRDYLSNNFSLPMGIQNLYYLSVSGLFLMALSFFVFTFSLILNTLKLYLFEDELKNERNVC